ncbi:plasmid stabilization protein [Rhodopseudomonas palustris]|uniref:FitA-like ribbon-helix-helix domain-containing protein n=1 Tax=Rhodopseudomonas palustris TaxID=1076 RepID=UPI002ACD7A04|nr:plasmid stabilization protein [Rhodopseudomonas palustris]WQH01938.1 plasmid stabilization protein [Rhodopseudomonas palustris]
MAVLTIRDIDDAIKQRLRVRAAVNGRSIEDEAREILRAALSTDEPRPRNLAQAIHERFAALGGVDLPETRREAILHDGMDR